MRMGQEGVLDAHWDVLVKPMFDDDGGRAEPWVLLNDRGSEIRKLRLSYEYRLWAGIDREAPQSLYGGIISEFIGAVRHLFVEIDFDVRHSTVMVEFVTEGCENDYRETYPLDDRLREFLVDYIGRPGGSGNGGIFGRQIPFAELAEVIGLRMKQCRLRFGLRFADSSDEDWPDESFGRHHRRQTIELSYSPWLTVDVKRGDSVIKEIVDRQMRRYGQVKVVIDYSDLDDDEVPAQVEFHDGEHETTVTVDTTPVFRDWLGERCGGVLGVLPVGFENFFRKLGLPLFPPLPYRK